MGCDIHDYIEVCINGVWQSLYTPILDISGRSGNAKIKQEYHDYLLDCHINNKPMNETDSAFFDDYCSLTFLYGADDETLQLRRNYQMFTALNGVRAAFASSNEQLLAFDGLPDNVSPALKAASIHPDWHSYGHVYFDTLLNLDYEQICGYGLGCITLEQAYDWLSKCDTSGTDEAKQKNDLIQRPHGINAEDIGVEEGTIWNPDTIERWIRFQDMVFKVGLSHTVAKTLLTLGVEAFKEHIKTVYNKAYEHFYLTSYVVPITYKSACEQIYNQRHILQTIVDRYCAGDATKARLVFWYDN